MKKLYLILFVMLTSVYSHAEKNIYSDENTQNQYLQDDGSSSKKRVTIKEYSTGTVYKEVAPNLAPTPSPQKSGSATNEDDPGFPGDPGQLPVGDGFIMLFVAGIFYFIVRKNHFKKKNHE